MGIRLVAQDNFSANLSKYERKLMASAMATQQLQLYSGLAFAAVAGVVYKAIEAYSKFEYQMAFVRSMMRKYMGEMEEDTDHWMRVYEDGVKRLSVLTGQSTEVLTQALYDIRSHTFEADAAMRILVEVAKMSVGGFTESSIATNLMTTALYHYDRSAKSASRIADIFFAAVERGKFRFSEFAQAMPTVIAYGKVMNLSLEELSGTVAFLSKRFPNVSDAARALEFILKGVVVATGRTQKGLKEISDIAAISGETLEEL